MYEWNWNDELGSRSRKPACLVVTPEGKVFRFIGEDIDGVVKVLNRNYKKNGKWSHTIFSCGSPDGTKIMAWRQSFEDGVFWPQKTWEEAFKAVKQLAPQALDAEIEAIIRKEWVKAAEKFDENRRIAAEFSIPVSVPPPPIVTVSALELFKKALTGDVRTTITVRADGSFEVAVGNAFSGGKQTFVITGEVTKP